MRRPRRCSTGSPALSSRWATTPIRTAPAWSSVTVTGRPGPPPRPHPAGRRQPRLQHAWGNWVFRVLRGARRAPYEGLVQLRRRRLARRSPEFELRGDRRLRHRLAPGVVARGPTSLRTQRPMSSLIGTIRDIAPAPMDRTCRSRRSGMSCMRPAPTWCSTGTITITSGSRRRTHGGASMRPMASDSSLSARVASLCERSDPASPTARCSPWPMACSN